MARPAELIKNSKLIQDSRVIDSKNGADTLKLWEGYREQAILWRSIGLLQIPATLVACCLAFYTAYTRQIILNVPPKPLPGMYRVDEIPDSEFIDVTTEFVNLIATYQPVVARRQFHRAMEFLKEPMLSRFEDEMMGEELRAVETTHRTQIFFIDPLKTTVRRRGNQLITVSLTGERLKIVSGKELPVLKTKFTVTMTTIPKNALNPFGIVITNVLADNVDSNGLAGE